MELAAAPRSLQYGGAAWGCAAPQPCSAGTLELPLSPWAVFRCLVIADAFQPSLCLCFQNPPPFSQWLACFSRCARFTSHFQALPMILWLYARCHQIKIKHNWHFSCSKHIVCK